MLAVETRPASPGLAARIEFLSDPGHYPEVTARVEVVETHLSWVFLTDRFAYKLKKDLASEPARHAHCRREVTLNRRLTDGVYFDSVPVTLEHGRLAIGGYGLPVDWLVWMRRLPRSVALDRLIGERRVPLAQLRECVALLSRHYRLAHPELLTADEWRERLGRRIDANLHELARHSMRLPAERLREIGAAQHAFLRHARTTFEARVAGGWIVEGHGDLRPEHIFLEARPQVIDCLDFSRELRVVDAAEELAFLALECERLGMPELHTEIFAAHAETCGDRPAPALVDFYASAQALNRAKVAIRHLRDASARDAPRWQDRARRYIDLAAAHCSRSTNVTMTRATLGS